MKKIVFSISTLVFMVFAVSAKANEPDEKLGRGDDKKKHFGDDTTKVEMVDAEDLSENTDSLLLFPSHDLYNSWDTTIFHPNLMTNMPDSAEIDLIDSTSTGFYLPNKGIVTSSFGWRKRRPHYGTDIALQVGDPVIAAFDGKVRIARYNSSYGNVVILRHANGLETVYAHLSQIDVKPGDIIPAGSQLGLGGNTGRSHGAHLHFEVRYLGKALNTEDIIDYTVGELKDEVITLTRTDFEEKYNPHNLSSKRNFNFPTYDQVANNSKKGNGKRGKSVKIRKGDTLARIAKRNHTTISAICKKNGIKKGKKLKAGAKLRV